MLTYDELHTAISRASVESGQEHGHAFYEAMLQRLKHQSPKGMLPEGYLIFEILLCSDMANSQNLEGIAPTNRAIGLPEMALRLMCLSVRRHLSQETQDQLKTIETNLRQQLAR